MDRGDMTSGRVMSKADDFRQYADEALRSATESKSDTEASADRSCVHLDASGDEGRRILLK
jgi:hypothetical protein